MKERPVSAVVGAFEIPIAHQIIPEREIEVSFWTKGQRMYSLVFLKIWQHWHSPQEPFRLDVFPLQNCALKNVNRSVRGDVEISAANRNAIDPGIFGKSI